ncbi:hypothetical protein EDB85DRAFT_2137967 [Lactarius pseudohatsudake]|nr:hypothetical protein EDB85DRAFT_2137967 [Lactarius pseudohatsudake]
MGHIANKGINCLTIHYRTRNVPPCDRALVRRLKEVVDFVEGLGRDVTVVENDDCSTRPFSRVNRSLASRTLSSYSPPSRACRSPPLPSRCRSQTQLLPRYRWYSANTVNHWASTKPGVTPDPDALMQDWRDDKFVAIKAAIDIRNLATRPSPRILSPRNHHPSSATRQSTPPDSVEVHVPAVLTSDWSPTSLILPQDRDLHSYLIPPFQ